MVPGGHDNNRETNGACRVDPVRITNRNFVIRPVFPNHINTKLHGPYIYEKPCPVILYMQLIMARVKQTPMSTTKRRALKKLGRLHTSVLIHLLDTAAKPAASDVSAATEAAVTQPTQPAFVMSTPDGIYFVPIDDVDTATDLRRSFDLSCVEVMDVLAGRTWDDVAAWCWDHIVDRSPGSATKLQIAQQTMILLDEILSIPQLATAFHTYDATIDLPAHAKFISTHASFDVSPIDNSFFDKLLGRV